MDGWQKLSAAMGSGLPDPNRDSSASDPVPPISIENKPAPGQHGPKGMAPRTTYSRVNTGAPPTPEAGTSDQKSQAPRGLEFLPKVAHQEKISMMTMMRRPSLHDLVKEAMEGTAHKVDVSMEAARQLNNGAAPLEQTKQASAEPESVPTEHCEKLASALDYLAKMAGEGTTLLGPGKGPGHLEVMKAESSDEPIQPSGQGHGKSMQVSTAAPMESSGVAKDPANAMATNADMQHKEQPADPINSKTAALLRANVERLFGKTAAAEPPAPAAEPQDIFARNLARLGIEKRAEDAIFPAQISAGPAQGQGEEAPPGASAAEQQVPSEPADVNSQKTMISSNDAAINYTKQQAKRDPKSDLGKVWTEPALSSATDKTLQEAFDNTGNAGVKISHDLAKTAAAQAMLQRMVEEVEFSKDASKRDVAKKGVEGARKGWSEAGKMKDVVKEVGKARAEQIANAPRSLLNRIFKKDTREAESIGYRVGSAARKAAPVAGVGAGAAAVGKLVGHKAERKDERKHEVKVEKAKHSQMSPPVSNPALSSVSGQAGGSAVQ